MYIDNLGRFFSLFTSFETPGLAEQVEDSYRGGGVGNRAGG